MNKALQTVDRNPVDPAEHTPSKTEEGDAKGVDASRETPSREIRFSLVIPALDEEDAIGETLNRSLAARAEVVRNTRIDDMQLVFVNDGCTDNTQTIVDTFSDTDVIKVVFEKNRGYGAAIQAGFMATDAELVGFMDADGTCDPLSFIEMINKLYDDNADIVLGARLNDQSEMPLIRRLGNWFFARLVGVISGQTISDSASGIRVIRRACLRKLVPLPDGLHFTPYMSCMASLDPDIRIEEVPVSYKERIGDSKLSVLKDGIKFLGYILFAGSSFNPISVLSVLGLLFFIGGLGAYGVMKTFGLGVPFSAVLLTAFFLVFIQAMFIGFLYHQLLNLLIGPLPRRRFNLRLENIICPKKMVLAGVVAFFVALVAWGTALFASEPASNYLALTTAALVLFSGGLVLGGLLLRLVWAMQQRVAAQRKDPFDPSAIQTTQDA